MRQDTKNMFRNIGFGVLSFFFRIVYGLYPDPRARSAQRVFKILRVGSGRVGWGRVWSGRVRSEYFEISRAGSGSDCVTALDPPRSVWPGPRIALVLFVDHNKINRPQHNVQNNTCRMSRANEAVSHRYMHVGRTIYSLCFYLARGSRMPLLATGAGVTKMACTRYCITSAALIREHTVGKNVVLASLEASPQTGVYRRSKT